MLFTSILLIINKFWARPWVVLTQIINSKWRRRLTSGIPSSISHANWSSKLGFILKLLNVERRIAGKRSGILFCDSPNLILVESQYMLQCLHLSRWSWAGHLLWLPCHNSWLLCYNPPRSGRLGAKDKQFQFCFEPNLFLFFIIIYSFIYWVSFVLTRGTQREYWSKIRSQNACCFPHYFMARKRAICVSY